jgi:putative FmdB family regulatory protein
MPLYDFSCSVCGERFEALLSPSAEPEGCPACGSGQVQRVFTPFAGPFTVAPRGLAARRSDDQRRLREEQRQQRRAARRAEPEKG